MKKIILIGLPVVLLAIVGYRIASHGDVAGTKSIDAYRQEMGIPVVVVPVKSEPFVKTRVFTGTVEGARQADVLASTTEEVVALPVKIGERVHQGQVVAELDADISSAMALKYYQTRAAYVDAKRDYERMQSLFETGAISKQALEKARMQFEIAEKNWTAARKLVKVQAPFTGVVTDIFYEIGETAMNGTPIIRIARLDEVLIKLTISESEIAGIANDQMAIVSVSAYPHTTFQGRLERLSLSADPATRSFTAWVRVANPEQKLRPGMFATVKLHVETRPQTLTIPEDALVTENGGTVVFVVTEGDVAEKRSIHIGERSGERVEVLDGLKQGELVVVLGHNMLAGGEKVKRVENVPSY